MDRRSVLRLLGGAGMLTLAACASSKESSVLSAPSTTAPDSAATTTGSVIPEETAGPFPSDGSNGPNVLSQDGVVRRDITRSIGSASGVAEGVRSTIKLTVTRANAALAGAAVYVWHCDREGRYSMYSEGAENENYLRGVQVAGDNGVVEFASIFPACYSGRWPHIHFEVFESVADATEGGSPIATSQMALPEDVCSTVFATSGYEQSVQNLGQTSLTSDNVFGDDGGVHELATVTGSVDQGYVLALTAAV